ncbi:MAG TPA: biopolymer transporter ExbD [Cyanobacteria bacterium UBA12227]|nr:biopolymer transporter ExbD [Cyanobacteria bacterium UBA12227]HAX85735.1 biopolymer transporter ExbD [Cyanobacteria bacterium UBA11370]HBY81585.1 biopolymer transporter ExbD [Cyanobacteria bacterium UBA11148]
MNLPDDSETPFEINIVPMVDVIFSILAFFIISSLYLTRSQGLPVNLPRATTAETQLPDSITVTINVNGEIFVNRQPIGVSELEERVRSQIGSGSNSQGLVIINADERVTHGRVVRVMDRLRQVEGVRLAIATQNP